MAPLMDRLVEKFLTITGEVADPEIPAPIQYFVSFPWLKIMGLERA
jgi:hypothetical protein